MALNSGSNFESADGGSLLEQRQPLGTNRYNRENNSLPAFPKGAQVHLLDTQGFSTDLQNCYTLGNILMPAFVGNDDNENKQPAQLQLSLLSQQHTAFQPFKTAQPLPPSSVSLNAHSATRLYSPFRYQLRRPVESWKYKERKNEDGTVEYLCCVCSAAYKHKKSLNKHYKDKHLTCGDENGKIDETDDSYTETSLEVSTTEANNAPRLPLSLLRRLPADVGHSRLSLRRLSAKHHCSQLLKRRKSDLPLINRHQPPPIDAHRTHVEPIGLASTSPPLDLSMSKSSLSPLHPPPPPLPLPREDKEEENKGGEEEVGPLKDRRVLTLLIQSVLTSLQNEPESAKSTDTISENTFNLLRSVGSILVSSTKRVPPQRHSATNAAPPSPPPSPKVDDCVDVAESHEDQLLIPCPYCPLKSRWFSELRAHVVNHSDHRMFGCCYCGYKAKWKWDVTKHMRRCSLARHVAHLPNSRLVRMVTFDPPPIGDLLCTYFPQEGLPGVGVELPVPPPPPPRPVSESTDEENRPLAIDEATQSSEDDSDMGPEQNESTSNQKQPDIKWSDSDQDHHNVTLKLTVKRCAACNMHFQNDLELQEHIEQKHRIS